MGAPAVPSSLVASHLDPSSQETANVGLLALESMGERQGRKREAKEEQGEEEEVTKEKEEKKREVTDCSSGGIQRKGFRDEGQGF